VGVILLKKIKTKQSWTVAKLEKADLFKTIAVEEKRPPYRTRLDFKYNKTSGNV